MWKLRDFGGNTAAFLHGGTEVSYALLDEYCSRTADAVGDRRLVFNLCSNTLASLVGYAGFLNTGIVPLMLAQDIAPALLTRLVEIYKPDFIWAPDARAAEIGYPAKFSLLGFSLLKTPYSHEYPLDADLALLLSTSGSTGDPKLVRQSYKNIRSNTDSIVEYLKIDSSERAITTLPMNYTYGLSIINTHLAVGAGLVLTDSTIMQRDFWAILKEMRATSFGGVPYTYEMLDRLRFFRMDLPLLKTATQAGGKLLPELHEKFAKWARESGKNFVVMYGQTEATARMSWLPPEKSLEKSGSMGIAIPRGKFTLIDADGAEISSPETVGELVYEGDNVALGYAICGADLSKGDEWGVKLATGDMAKFDSDGYFYIVGRKKRFLKIFGNRVNLDECERMLKSKFGIECACAGCDDKMKIYLTSPTAAADAATFIAQTTGLNKSAFEVFCLAELPKSASGKTLYSELGK